MKAKLKLFLYSSLWAVSFIGITLTGCSSNIEKITVTPQQVRALYTPTVEEMQKASNPTSWHMTWIDDFGLSELQHEGMSSDLEKFILSTMVRTSEIDGKTVTMSARTKSCMGISWAVRRQVVTPAQSKKVIIDGNVEYEVTPAILEPYVEAVSVGGACTLHVMIDGKKYDTDWYELMNKFIQKNFRQIRNIRRGDKLEWVDPAGAIIARFEKVQKEQPH